MIANYCILLRKLKLRKYIPVREFDGIEVVVGSFWKVFELKKLLLSA